MSVFLDNNATTQPLPEVIDAMADSMRTSWGNPSSGYASADVALVRMTQAREHVAALAGTLPENVYFTSGGTEANNLAILLGLQKQAPLRTRFVTSAIEHASVLSMIPSLAARGIEVVEVESDRDGRIKIEQVYDALNERTALVSLQWVNNETGVVQPIEGLVERCRQVGCLFHVDAAQALGKLPVNLGELGADFMTFTAHKIHGPKGVGALVYDGAAVDSPQIFGGTQEAGIRPGTQNMPGICGFGHAAKLRLERLDSVEAHCRRLRDAFEEIVGERCKEMKINGGDAPRVSNTTNMMFEGVDGIALVNRLHTWGIECSQSSACTQARPEPSHVLTAMGLNEEEAYASIRFSFSELNSDCDVERAAKVLNDQYKSLREATIALNC